MSVIYLNGKMMPLEHAHLAANDRGYLLGDGLFETIRVYAGHPFELERHIARLYDSAKRVRIELPETPGEMMRAVQDCVAANGGGNATKVDASLRITISRGPSEGGLSLDSSAEPTRVIWCRPVTPIKPETYLSGVSCVVARIPNRRFDPRAGIKSLSYLDLLLHKDAAVAQGAFEAILVDEDGFVVEGATSNVFVAKDGRIATPPLSRGPLPGIAREVVLELAAELAIPADERDLTLDDIHAADEIFLTSSNVEVLPVSYLLDLSVIKNNKPEIAALLREAYSARVEATRGGGNQDR